jgi:8-oxo-dGTP pyrophosphatase MutT (NUDIX family)
MPHATLPLFNDAKPAQQIDKLREMIDDLYRYQLGASVAKIIAILEQHPCEDDKERADVQRIITLAQRHPNITSPLCEVGHITGSSMIVHAASRRVLLNHHRKFDRWMQFGGHMDNDLEPHVTALREAREETGLMDLQFIPLTRATGEGQGVGVRPFDVDVHAVPARNGRPDHLHLDLRYLLATNQPDSAQATDESNEIRWFSLDELQALDLEPEVWRMIRKAQVAFSAVDGR